MATEDFIPVVGDDWYQRRRRDAEGEFFRRVSNQGPRKHAGIGGPTRQGLYLMTASGKLLGYRNHSDPARMRAVIKEALAAWRALPKEERAGGATDVPALEVTALDARYHREIPASGLVLRVHTRVLERDGDGGYQRCAELPSGVRGIQSARDHMWLLEKEWRALCPPANARVGDRIAFPAAVLTRLSRYHLVDNTRGEPPFWTGGEVRSAELALVVTAISKDLVRMSLQGSVRLRTEAEGGRAYEPELFGALEYLRSAAAFTKIQLIAIGDHRGEGRWNPGARPGSSTLGIVFELLRERAPADCIPPHASRDLNAYYGKY